MSRLAKDYPNAARDIQAALDGLTALGVSVPAPPAAALVPGPGWAIAGGIVAGVAASYVWDAAGGSKLGAQVGGWVGDRVADVGTGVKNVFGGLSHVFG